MGLYPVLYPKIIKTPFATCKWGFQYQRRESNPYFLTETTF